MSFDIVLQKNNSDDNVLSKSIENLSTVTGTLKEKTSILSPVITISGAIPIQCNYMYIAEFGRYYFVEDITSVHNNVFEVSARVDVLQTYASQIRACTGIVARQKDKWNLYVDDGTFKTYQNPLLTIKKFPNGFTTQEFVLAVAGGSSGV